MQGIFCMGNKCGDDLRKCVGSVLNIFCCRFWQVFDCSQNYYVPLTCTFSKKRLRKLWEIQPVLSMFLDRLVQFGINLFGLFYNSFGVDRGEYIIRATITGFTGGGYASIG